MSFKSMTGTVAAMAVIMTGSLYAQESVRREVREEVHPNGAVTTSVRVIEMPSDTLVRIRLLDTLDSRHWKEGDHFPYEVSQDVILNGQVAIPAGTKGAGIISESREAGSFGRSGKLELSFGSLAIGGTNLDLALNDKARQGNEKEHLAAGASLAGLIVAGPIGLVGGLFIKGKNVTIPAGSEMYVATAGTARLDPALIRSTTTTTTTIRH